MNTLNSTKLVTLLESENSSLDLIKLAEHQVLTEIQREVSERYPVEITISETAWPRGVEIRGKAFDPVSVFEELKKLTREFEELRYEFTVLRNLVSVITGEGEVVAPLISPYGEETP